MIREPKEYPVFAERADVGGIYLYRSDIDRMAKQINDL